MNNDRRLRIKKNNERIKLVCELLEIYKKEMELIQEDEEEAYDNLPDSFQNGIKGEIIQEAIDELEDNISQIDDIVKQLDDIRINLSTL